MTLGAGHPICDALAQSTGALITYGNRLRLLRDGGTFFPELLSAVQRARRTVSVQMYRFHGGGIATRLAHAFAERARAGVHVRVLIDDYGTGGMDRDLATLLAASGVELRIYNPLRLTRMRRVNRRNHRKLIVIDNSEAFVGGMNFDDVFSADEGKRAWRENAAHVLGPVSHEIDASISATWEEDGQPARWSAQAYLPENPLIRSDAQLLLSSHERQTLRTAYLHVFRTAVRSVHLSTAYLVPEPDLAEALMEAARRGIDVRLLTTGAHNNIALTRAAGHATYGQLLRAGVRIFEFRPTMLHAKSIIVDGEWCALGSANLDACGFRFNLESQLATCDPTFVEKLQQSFHADTRESDEVTLDSWQRRPVAHRLRDSLVRPLRFLL